MQEFALLGVVMLLALGAYWSLVIFPRQRDFEKRHRYVRTLNVGDEVITSSGIIGRIVTLNEDGTVIIEIANGVEIKMLAVAIQQQFNATEIKENTDKAMSSQKEA
jgi:preprotein translocase subunit YajC